MSVVKSRCVGMSVVKSRCASMSVVAGVQAVPSMQAMTDGSAHKVGPWSGA